MCINVKIVRPHTISQLCTYSCVVALNSTIFGTPSTHSLVIHVEEIRVRGVIIPYTTKPSFSRSAIVPQTSRTVFAYLKATITFNYFLTLNNTIYIENQYFNQQKKVRVRSDLFYQKSDLQLCYSILLFKVELMTYCSCVATTLSLLYFVEFVLVYFLTWSHILS